MRDVQLDNYRALAMIYILCIGHMVYWLLNGNEPYISFVLFIVPQLFFLSGAAVSVSRSKRGLLSTVANRFKRIVVPYYIYAIVALAIAVAVTVLVPDVERFGIRPFHLSDYGPRDVADILLCKNIPGIAYMAHLWFIIPYLILSSTFPFQIKLMQRVNRHVYMAACIAAFLIAQAFTPYTLLRELLCFNIFLVAGYLYYKKCGVMIPAIVGLMAMAALLIYQFLLGGNFAPIQDHKFPPDWVYMTYSLMMLCVLSLVLRKVYIPQNRILRIWNERGYTIYLYQSIVFAVIAILRYRTYMYTTPLMLRMLIDAVLIFVLSTALSYLTYPLERFIMKKLK